jgi:hypothetical protein
MKTVAPRRLARSLEARREQLQSLARCSSHEFVPKITAAAKAMRQGPPLNGDGNTGVDIGAMCMPGEGTIPS